MGYWQGGMGAVESAGRCRQAVSLEHAMLLESEDLVMRDGCDSLAQTVLSMTLV